MRHLTTGLVILTFLAGPAIGEQEPFLGFEGPVFPNPVTPTNQNSWQLIEADFNEDGVADFASVSGDRVFFLIGNGDCTFELSSLPVFAGGRAAIADFNEDGHQDVAAANQTNGFVVALGDGDGTFSAPVTYIAASVHLGALSWPVVVADFDEDNNLDVVLGFYSIGDNVGMAFFPGNGDGTFDPPTVFSSGDIFDIAVGDFDENTDLDLLANNVTPMVRLGTGTGMFVDAGSFPVGADPLHYLVFDFDGDTHLDFATANNGSDNVSVRLGNGDGTFNPETTYSVGPEPWFLEIGDVDSDGNEDLLVSHARNAYVSLLTGNGDGTFDAEVQVPTVYPPFPMVLSDLDDDGYLDLVYGTASAMIVQRGLGDGTFEGPDPALVVSSGAPDVVATAFGNMNGDGLQDVVLVRDEGTVGVTVRLAGGDGSFNVSASPTMASTPNDVAIADVNNDTDSDVIVTTLPGRVVVFLGNGDGTLGPSTAVSQEVDALTTGLFDSDANVDLAVITAPPNPEVHILLGNGDATFSPGGFFGVGSGPTKIETGDFNEDTETDLVVLDAGSDELSILLGNGDGTFQPEVRYGTGQLFVSANVIVVDVDDDGHQDLVVSYPADKVLYGVGDGTFAAATDVNAFFSFRTFAIKDVNGDGRPDQLAGSRALELKLRQGDGSLGDSQYFAGEGYFDILVEDTNGDGRNDVIQTHGSGVDVLLNVEPAPFNFAADKVTMNWPAVTGALSYNVYRGLISSLIDGDSDGLPDAGYGDCQNALDPDTTDQHYVDASVPPPGDGYFYLIAAVDWAGERYLGRTSDGLARFPGTPCP